MVFVKVYQYHIQKEKVEEYVRIQKRASDIYKKYLDVKTIYLQSMEDGSKWMEISTYKNEEEYNRNISLINKEEQINKLFNEFQSLLLCEKEIVEEDFKQQDIRSFSTGVLYES